MAHVSRRSKLRIEHFYMVLPGATIFATLLMIVPIWPAITAGIASTSMLFAVAGLGLLALLPFAPRKTRPILLATLCVAILSCLVPQFAFGRTASSTNTSLAFDPLSYLHFSGNTDIKPTTLVDYKSTGSQTLKIAYYKPSQSGLRPVVVLLHGGAWRYGNYLETGSWPSLLTRAGYAVVSVQYRLASDSNPTWQDAPTDVHDAVSYIKNNAPELEIDPDKITMFGQSAGGHLALLEAYTSSDTIDAVISLYAPIDLASDYETSSDKSAQLDFIGGPPSQFAQRYKQLSPYTHVSSSAPDTLLVQGRMDDLVNPADTVRFSQALTRANVPHETIILPLTGHSFDNQRGGFATQITQQRVLRFLSR